ncbi:MULTISPECIES: LysR family transcriptional regulator [Anaerotruncus]|jgi:DNA-binding transcriptional LysR family regulator|uniref:LysR family transcriptional regulator n=1 Tax=Anaerotruncus TaxID=244127 RepID=UPI00083694E4|nr:MULTISPECIES: LysR family transcriptional regulator [Anaerotruncus]RGX55480.1 LysR family transcriptional regulator [Anaerotruncus sp. AF02-27]
MKLEHLRYVITTVEQGSISKAAQSLFLTQPHLSKIIREVENEIRYPIFLRQSDGIALTQKGAQFLLHARRMLNEADSMFALSHEPEQTHHFSISTVRTSLVLDCFLQLLQEHQDDPYLQFSICENGNNTAIDDVYTQNAELGIVYLLAAERKNMFDRLSRRGISYHRICPLPHQIIISCEHPLLELGRPVTREDLYPYGMLRYGRGMVFGSENADSIWYNSFLDLNRIGRTVYVYDRATMHNLLTATDFFTLGTSPAIYQESLHKIVSIPFTESSVNQEAIVEMGYIHLDGTPYTEVCSRFIELLNEAYAPGGSREPIHNG